VLLAIDIVNFIGNLRDSWRLISVDRWQWQWLWQWQMQLRFIVPRDTPMLCISWIVGQMTTRVFISCHNLYEPTYLLNVLAVVLTAQLD